MTPLDDERRWYRYHHLFGEVLRERLRRGTNVATVANLHGRASAWYQQHGMIDEAVQHALAAGAVVDAARLIEQHGLMLIVQGHRSRVLTWMEALPDAVIRAHPDLCIVHVAALVLGNQLAAAEARLHDAENAIRADIPTEAAQIIRGRVAQGYADLARYRGDLVRYITLSRQVLDIVPESDALGRAAAMMHLSRAYLVSGHITSEMEQQAVAVIEPARASGNVLAWLIALLNLAQVRALRGRLQQAAATYQAALTVAPNLDAFRHLYGSAAYYVGMGDIFREWNDLDSAEQHLAQSRELAVGEQLVDPDVILRGYSALARLRMAQGDDAGALDAIDEFLDLAHQRAFFPGLSRQALAVQTRIRLGQGNLAAATAWADSCGLQVDDATNYLREFEYLTLVRVRIAQRRSDGRAGDLDDALRILDQLSAAAEMSERLGSLVEIVLLRALVFDSQGDSDAALRELERVLNLAKPEGYVRVFVDEGVSMAALLRAAAQQGIASSYVARLLAAFPEGPGARDLRLGDAAQASRHKPQASVLAEPLTARELEVLRLLAEGASNGEIAQRLIISLSTVKKHIANIFGKLEAQSRTQAVARARALNLL